MPKWKAIDLFAALQRTMRHYKVDSIQVRNDRVVFVDRDDKTMCGFEALDLSSDDLSECLIDAGWSEL